MKTNVFNRLIVVLLLFFAKSFAQKSSYAVTTLNDTIYVDKYTILNKKVKLHINGEKKEYGYDELKSLYDSKNKKLLEKITPALVEYKGPTGGTFFAELLTTGKIKVYKYLTNQSHIGVVASSTGLATSAGGTSSSFFSFYIGIQDSRPEFLCYFEMEMSKNEYRLLKIYLHSNETIEEELEALYFSEQVEKESSIIELVNKYNNWAALQK